MHISIMTNEITDLFKDSSGLLIDCTIGFGGHSSAILKANKNIKIIAIDRDKEALAFCQNKFSIFQNKIFEALDPIEIKNFMQSNERVLLISMNFGGFAKALGNILTDFRDGAFCGILADLGISSFQIDFEHRGFSFKGNTLDMRMDVTQHLSAAKILQTYNEMELERIFREFGELNEAKKIAKTIINMRDKVDIKNAQNFNNAIKSCSNFAKILPLCYQALRIEVNNELGELKMLLDFIENATSKPAFKGAKVAILSFHSLEDRLVKNAFKNLTKSCICDERALKCACGNNNAKLKLLTKKPLIAQKDELDINPRANCAKLRMAEFII